MQSMEFNASTFNGRVAASTLTDIFSVITGAIGTLRGPLHGGANEAAMSMIEQWQTPDEAEEAILQKLANKELIMGFGHAVYKERDPRNAIIKKWSEKLAIEIDDQVLYPVSVRVEEVMKREKRHVLQRRLFPCIHLPFHGYTDWTVHTNIRDVSSNWMGRTCV